MSSLTAQHPDNVGEGGWIKFEEEGEIILVVFCNIGGYKPSPNNDHLLIDIYLHHNNVCEM